MKACYYLSTCSTCNRIIDQLEIRDNPQIRFVDIKTGISTSDLNKMRKLSGSYESLFSRRAMKYKSMGLAEKNLQEEDFEKLILSEYTFLKRPVFIIDDEIFIGNSKKVVESLGNRLRASFV